MAITKENDSNNIYKVEEETKDGIFYDFIDNIQIIKEQKQILDF